MATITPEEIKAYVEANIARFHDARLKNLTRLPLSKVLARKNPYLFKARNIVAPRELVQALLDAHLSSQEETPLGAFLEELAIFVCAKVYGGRKSTAKGIDLEFERDARLNLVTIKSGPNWGNSGQIADMRESFRLAKRIYSQGSTSLPVELINGCCYGRSSRAFENKGDYLKLCGQRFWEYISGDSELFVKIIEPLGAKARERNEAFKAKYELVLDAFVEKFRADFCDENNLILWEKLARYNSAENPPKLKMDERPKKGQAAEAADELLAQIAAEVADAPEPELEQPPPQAHESSNS
jgi:hypothetical protein